MNKTNIVLIGMPGSGKTTIGKIISRKTKIKLYDIDRVLEERENDNIPNIIEKYGEKHFRDLETKYTKELSNENHCIISTGGGIILKEENMISLREKGVVVYIKRPVEDIKRQPSIQNRPLVKDNLEVIDKLYKERCGLYEKYADITIDNVASDIVDVVNLVLKSKEVSNILYP